MAMKIRLARGGSKKRPSYSIVAADSRSPAPAPPAFAAPPAAHPAQRDVLAMAEEVVEVEEPQ